MNRELNTKWTPNDNRYLPRPMDTFEDLLQYTHEGKLSLVFPEGAQIKHDLVIKSGNKIHPRIIANRETFNSIKRNIALDTRFEAWFDIVKAEADKYLIKNTLVDEFMLDLRVKPLDCILTLGLVYNITEDDKFAKKALSILSEIARIKEWCDHTDFLTIAFLGKTFSIGYDWFYNYMSDEERKFFSHTIMDRVLTPGLISYRNPNEFQYNAKHWIQGDHNWNPTCNGGLAMAAISVFEEYEEAAIEIIQGGLKSIGKYLYELAPDGAWKEGVYYWYWGVNSLIQYVSTLESALGTDYGIADTLGFSNTPYFALHMTGPKGIFIWADSANKDVISSEFLWFAQKFQDRKLANYYLKRKEMSRQISPMDIIWYNPEMLSIEQSIRNCNDELELDRYFRRTESASLTSSWGDQNRTYVAFKGGYNNETHGDLSIGTFILDALGERWAEGLGAQNYDSPGYWEYSEVGKRWLYYRMRAEGHNTLLINPGLGPDQDVYAFSYVKKFKSYENKGFGIINMTDAYKKDAVSVKRGIKLCRDKNIVVIQDEIHLLNSSDIWWFMHTRANIEVSDNGKSAILSLNGKNLYVEMISSVDVSFSIMRAEPLDTSPKPEENMDNDGVKKLTVNVKNIKDLELAIVFKPLSDDMQLRELQYINDFVFEPLENWE